MNNDFKNYTKESAKSRRNIRNYFNKKKQQEENLQESVEMFADMDKDKIYSRIGWSHRNKIRKHEEIKDQVDIEVFNAESIYPKIFASVVYEALDLTKKEKLANIKNIFEQAEDVFVGLSQIEVLEFANSPIFNNVFTYAKTQIQGVDHKMSKEEVLDIVKDSYMHSFVELDFLKEKVADKVAKAIMDEKEIIKVAESLKENDQYVDDSKTFFRFLHESNIEAVLNMKDSEGDSPEVFQGIELDEHKVKAAAFKESMLHYTILETLHTSKLTNYSHKEIISSFKTLLK